jgi:hypothetical protein
MNGKRPRGTSNRHLVVALSTKKQKHPEGRPLKYTIAEIHAPSIRRLSKIEAADDPSDGADEA